MDRVFSFVETPDSRQETGVPPSLTLNYLALGVQDDEYVYNYALSNTPLTIIRGGNLLVRKDIRKDPAGWGQYRITVPYGLRDKIDVPSGSFTFSFDTTGATIKIKAAKEHIASYPDDGDWHKGAIGVKEDGDVEGADIIIPALKLTYSFKHPAGVVDEAFARYIASITGRVNLNGWRGYQPGELLFAGGSGSDGSDAEADVAYQFIASGNEDNLSIGDISGIVKAGHHYAWVEFQDDVDTGEAIRPPKRVNIERVYDAIDFATGFGFS